jgi:hypothetical protein
MDPTSLISKLTQILVVSPGWLAMRATQGFFFPIQALKIPFLLSLENLLFKGFAHDGRSTLTAADGAFAISHVYNGPDRRVHSGAIERIPTLPRWG